MWIEACDACGEQMSSSNVDRGDVDLAAVGAVLADSARAKVLLALGDGRSLPASVLAAEAGVAASTASHHLTRLVEAGLTTVTTRGKYRYYALPGPHVGALIEAVALCGHVTAWGGTRRAVAGGHAALLRAQAAHAVVVTVVAL
jgi:DNA-binding transcriptional ArsR family regulator